MTPQDSETFTYRGRSLEELVPRIRQDLGDDAVIVSRRETSTGGVGGFFAKREIEVEVRPGQTAPNIAAAFAQQLQHAHERQQQSGGADALRPMISAEVDALPGSTDVSVDDLFPPVRPAQADGLAALFNAGLPPAVEPAEPAPPVDRPPHGIIEDDDEYEYVYEDEDDDLEPEPEGPVAAVVEEPVAPERTPLYPVEQPTGAFDYVGTTEPDPEPVAEPVAAVPPPVTSLPIFDAPAEPVAEPIVVAAEPRIPQLGLAPAALAAAERLVARGLRPGLAEAIAEEAMAGLAPLLPGADPKELVSDALARRIPLHALRRGPGVVGFVGPGGAGKTRCVARLAAAHARHGALPVTVLALRSPDGGAELRRLLAPYGVALHAVESGAEGAARVATLRGDGLVIVDTPGVSPRSSGELRTLGVELDSLAPDELHLAVPATIGPDAARELVGGIRELGVSALVLTHTDETEMLGTVIGLAIDSGLPLSYLARGQAVEAGLHPASATELAADLLP
jgi:flagellar biosynthesis GTPase FlhF